MHQFSRTIATLIIVLVAFWAQAQEERKVGAFDEIRSNGSFDIKLEKGKEESVRIDCKGKTTVDDIVIEVQGSKLIIKPKEENYKKNHYVQATITVIFKELKKVSLSGSGSVSGEDEINAESFELNGSGSGNFSLYLKSQKTEISLSGSGNATLKGQGGKTDLSLSGSGNMKAIDFQATTLDVSISGSGSVNMSVSESLSASISGSGNINYKGSPRVEKIKVSGSGNVSRIKD